MGYNSTDRRQISKAGPSQIATSGAAVLHLGRISQVAPSEKSELAQKVFDLIDRARRFAGKGNDRATQAPLTFAGYKTAIQKRDSILRAIHQNNFIADDSPELRRFVGKLYDPERHTPDFGGYVNYAGAVNETLGISLLNLVQHAPGSLFREADLSRHACVVGGSGSGKSELLKLIAHHYVKHPELGSVVIVDPHGKVAAEVARWREFAKSPERLVYLDAKIYGEDSPVTPALNPIHAPGASQSAKAAMAGQLAEAIGILRDADRLTPNMVSLAKRCLRVLLDVPNADLSHLVELLEADRSDPLVKAALASPDPDHRRWFDGKIGFFADTFQSTKEALSNRVAAALFHPELRNVLTAPNPIDLEAAINAGKIICVNCASVGGTDERNLLGRLVMAQVAAIGQRRISNQALPRTPVKIIVDEAAALMSPAVFEILQELRKVNVSLIMGQQVLGSGANSEQLNAIRTNTHVKMVAGGSNRRELFKLMGWDADAMELGEGDFAVAWGDAEKVILNTYAASYLADDRNAMDDRQWRSVCEYQVVCHYRPTAASTPPLFSVETPAVPATPADDYEWPR